MITNDVTLEEDSDSEFATGRDTLPTFNKSVDAMYNKFEFRRKQKLRHPKSEQAESIQRVLLSDVCKFVLEVTFNLLTS